jgi:hypothetical protein
MKKLIYISILILTIGCDSATKSYYEQISSEKAFTERINDINKTIEEIRKEERGKLINEGLDRLKYEFEVGKGDRYIVTYLFDEKGCFEIGFDGYFANKEDVLVVLDGFKSEIDLTKYQLEESPELFRYSNSSNSLTLEIDYANADKGMALAMIFANE